MKTIIVTDYDEAWPQSFAQIRAYLWPAVQDLATTIEHVGSTAVPGLAAKPIIDIDIVIPAATLIGAIVKRLEPLGYEHRGDLGIVGRDAFRQQNALPTHHLYVCPAGSIGLQNHLIVRDYLRAHPEVRQAYGDLKKRLAVDFPTDIDRYVDGKTDLILAILQTGSLSAAQLAGIQAANRLP